MARAAIDPARKGHQQILFRQPLQDVKPPAWVREVVVVADAGDPAHLTLPLMEDLQGAAGLAMPRPRKFADGRYGREVVHHLPTALSRRRATSKPDGRRQDDWLLMRHAKWPQLGDVTIGRSQKRRTCGPKRVKSIVTHRLKASARALLSH
jgi:hypothetical protein